MVARRHIQVAVARVSCPAEHDWVRHVILEHVQPPETKIGTTLMLVTATQTALVETQAYRITGQAAVIPVKLEPDV